MAYGRVVQPVRMVFQKWGGGRHWEYDAYVLGTDRHGTWLGAPRGTTVARPGVRFVSTYEYVSLVPDAGFVVAFYSDSPDAPVELYVDIATSPRWDGAVVRAVDLDLDVLAQEPGSKQASARGESFIDDEDEFAEHTVQYGYPPSVVAQVRADADRLLAAVRAGEAPYDGPTAERWFAVLDAL